MRRLWMLCLLAACLPPTENVGPATTGMAAADTGTTAPITISTTGTGTGTTIAGSTIISPTTTNDASTGSSGATFIVDPDSEGVGGECDVYAQDCPPGQKCAWTASQDAQFWDTTTCVPLVRDPLPDGAPCTYPLDSVFEGIDECGPAAMCVEGYFGAGEWDGQATCMALCKGSGEHPYCETGAVCVGSRTLWLCMPTCDPLAQDCPTGERCDFYGSATLCTYDFPEEPRHAVGEPCDWPQQCELGATCIQAVTETCGESTCCTPFCDLADPQAKCPLPGQQCLPPHDWGQPDPSLGVCRTEAP